MATILTDNFNSYDDGDLNGQGDWSGDAEFDVQETTVKEGAKAIQVSGDLVAGKTIIKEGSSLADGAILCYLRQNGNGFFGAGFGLNNESDQNCASLYLFSDGKIYAGISGGTVDMGAYAADTWYACEIEWHSSPSDQTRFRINGGAWSGWQTPINTWTALDTVYLYADSNMDAGEIAYFDYIRDPDITIEPPAFNLNIEMGVPAVTPSLTVEPPAFNLNMQMGIPTLDLLSSYPLPTSIKYPPDKGVPYPQSKNIKYPQAKRYF